MYPVDAYAHCNDLVRINLYLYLCKWSVFSPADAYAHPNDLVRIFLSDYAKLAQV
jgi:hypothetical protein